MTRIVPGPDDSNVSDYETLEICIKSIPFESSFAPVFYISSPSDEYPMTISELACLMDGLEIAKKTIDDIIDFLLKFSQGDDDGTS